MRKLICLSATALLIIGFSALSFADYNQCDHFFDQETNTFTLIDTTPPEISASLEPADDEGRFIVDFEAIDNCDSNPSSHAVLLIPGHSPVIVFKDQIVSFEYDDEETEVEWEHSIVEIAAPNFTLHVTATDASGNMAVKDIESAWIISECDAYDNRIFSGNWLFNVGSDAIYFIGDGQGGIIEHSGIVSIFVGETPETPGSYMVNPDGSFEIVINGDEGTFLFNGQMISKTQGIIIDQPTWSIKKIVNPAACRGFWKGVMTPFDGDPIKMRFHVDRNGNVTHIIGIYKILSGKMFKQDKQVVFKFYTDDNMSYNQISLGDGVSSKRKVAGTYHIDAAGNPAGEIFLRKLKKKRWKPFSLCK